jgi:signal transduction histidine kinase
VILLRNITPFKELDFAKTHFIATISHELKTPISSIKMSVDLLDHEKVGELNTEQKQLVGSIKEDAVRLLKITGELLNMSQVESGNMQLKILSCEVRPIVDFAIGANKLMADQKQITIHAAIPENLGRAHADAEKTSWVLSNLLSNAIRYSYENSTIHIEAMETNNAIKISVKDFGQGIAPEYKERIFDRYFRVPGSRKEGTGLGLFISKELMEAQGGSIEVDSEYGLGSMFSISLPKA